MVKKRGKVIFCDQQDNKVLCKLRILFLRAVSKEKQMKFARVNKSQTLSRYKQQTPDVSRRPREAAWPALVTD